MQLRIARLCLDCEEVHDAQQCPVCGSESFAYITRWIPAPDRRTKPRQADSEARARTAQAAASDVETYRQILAPEHPAETRMRWLKRGAVGLAAVSLARWLWHQSGTTDARGAATGDSTQGEG